MARKSGLAEDLRAGLSSSEGLTELKDRSMHVVVGSKNKNASPAGSVLDRLEFRKPVRLHLREFSSILAIILFAYASYSIWHYGITTSNTIVASVGMAILAFGYFVPIALYPIWKGWMFVGSLLQHAVTWTLLALTWTLMFIPMSLLVRLLKIKCMNLQYGGDAKSYWENRAAKDNDFQLLKRQF